MVCKCLRTASLCVVGHVFVSRQKRHFTEDNIHSVRVTSSFSVWLIAFCAVLVCLHPHDVSYFLFTTADADYKMCSGRRRGCRKDLLTDLLHNQQVPLRICAYGKRIS